jgi:diacylglycerol kinase family enzyme
MPDYAAAAKPPLHIVLNAGSGRTAAGATRAIIEDILTAARREHTLTVVDDPARLVAIARETVARAKAGGGIVVAAGGDGTLNAVAQVTLGSGCVFGVLPQGTFNYFGRAHGIPSDTAAATQVLLTGLPQPVQVGLVNDRIFLVNASVGLYPQLLEDREAWNRQYGRSRIVALAAGLATVLRHRRHLRITIEHYGQTRDVRTRTLFVGNNPLQLVQIGIPLADALATGQLAAIMLRPVGTLPMLWLIARGAIGQLGEADNVISFGFDGMTVRRPRFLRTRRMKVATDGEVAWLDEPVRFCVSPEPLHLIKPAVATPAVADDRL